MSEASERNQLGRLARSVDALFSGREAGVAAVPEQDARTGAPEASPEEEAEAERLVSELATVRDEERHRELIDACVRSGLPPRRSRARTTASRAGSTSRR